MDREKMIGYGSTTKGVMNKASNQTERQQQKTAKKAATIPGQA